MSFTVQQIDHVEVFVNDIEAAIRWYRETLGLELIARWDPEPAMIGAGNTKLALFTARGPGEAPLDGGAGHPLRWHRVAWLTDRNGFDAAQSHLKSRGITFRGPIDHDTWWSIYFADPDGHPLEITTPKQ